MPLRRTSGCRTIAKRQIMTIDVDNSSSNLRFDPFPAQESIAFTYPSHGLMQTMTDARQHTHQFSFDSLGQLTQDNDSAGGFTHLDRADLADGYQITNSTATSHLSTYRIENLPTGDQLRINTGTDGSRTTNIIGADALTSTLSPDGSMSSVLQGLDPRWGMQAPLANSITNR